MSFSLFIQRFFVLFAGVVMIASSTGCDKGTVCYALCITDSEDPDMPNMDQMCIQDLANKDECATEMALICEGDIVGGGLMDGEPIFDEDCHSCDANCVEYPLVGAKPNIYLYPEEKSDVAVSLEMSQGTWVFASYPEYVDGWSVSVEPDGLIDGAYDYLFYEAKLEGEFQRNKGWAVPQEEVISWFEKTLFEYGFNEREVDDFISYWAENLPWEPCYNIYPQLDEEISSAVGLVVDPMPASVLRLWFLLDGSETCSALTAPQIPVFSREGFTVTEWGLVI